MRRVGERVARFLLLEHLGTGGMGDVFVARDERLDRDVAVKAIRPESLSADLRDRLVREARLLSALDHENICRIYELIEEDDEAFLILELIRGRDLRQALEDGLSFKQKLELAERIALALEVAHRHEIIHRDLKLENVMLRQDGVVKVLDFGVARSLQGEPRPPRRAEMKMVGPSLGPPSSRNSSLTRLGEAVGTVSTMSPEQARGEEVSPATDLYSLGLLLQELFTGASPYPSGLEEEVLWLRARDGDTLSVEGLDKELTGLIRDLKSSSPAARPTASEALTRLRRIRGRGARRLRAAGIAALLSIALIGAVKYTVDLRRERNIAVEARLEAERRGEESAAVVDLLVRLFEASDPTRARGEDLRASELLARGDQLIDDELADQPLVRARLMETIARVSRLLGEVDRAEELFTDALETRRRHQEAGHGDIARVESEKGDLFRILGRHEEARALLEASLAKLEPAAGPSSEVIGAGPAALVTTLNRLGALSLEQGRFKEASSSFQRAIEARLHVADENDHLIIAARNNLAIAYLQMGEHGAAAAEHSRVLETRRQILGSDHPDIGTSLNNLAVAHYLQGNLEESESLLVEALAIWRRVFGEEHPEVATAIYNLGELALERDEIDLAAQRYEEALTMWRSVFGEEHPDLAYAWQGLGHVARERGQVADARGAYLEALRLRQTAFGSEHPEVEAVRQDLAALP